MNPTFYLQIIITFLFTCSTIVAQCQNKMGKINFYTVIVEDPEYQSKMEVLKHFADSIELFINNLPEVKTLIDERNAVENKGNDVIYAYKIDEIDSKLREYEFYMNDLISAKQLELFYTKVFRNSLQNIVENEHLNGMMILERDSFQLLYSPVMGIEFMSPTFEKQLKTDIENYRNSLLDKNVNPDDDIGNLYNANIMETDYTDKILEDYVKHAMDYNSDVIKMNYKTN